MIISFEVLVLLIGQSDLVGLFPLADELLDVVGIDGELSGLQGESFNQVQVGVSRKSSENPKEGFFVLIV